MNDIIFQSRPLISRLSSSLSLGGKKVLGHKVLLQSLAILRSNTEKKVFTFGSEKESSLNDENNFFLTSILSLGFTPQKIQGFLKHLESNNLEDSSKKKDTVFFDKMIKAKAFTPFLKDKLEPILNPSDSKKSSTPFNGTKDGKVSNKLRVESGSLPSLSKKNSLQGKKKLSLNPSTVVEGASTLEQRSSKKPSIGTNLSSKSAKISIENALSTIVEDTIACSNRFICEQSRDNVKPIVESRKVRRGRVTYKVPLVTTPERQEGKAIALLVESARHASGSRKRKMKSVSQKNKEQLQIRENSFSLLSKEFYNRKTKSRDLKSCFALELLDSFKGKGESVSKKREFHKDALQNRAYIHYRWW